jgi:cytochrome P450
LLPAFSTRKARAAEPVLRESANSLIDNFIAQGNVELRSQFSDPLMVGYVLQELHCSPDDVPKLLGWADLFARLQGSRIDDDHLDHVARARVQFDEYFEAKIAQVRENPTDDVLSKLVHADVDGDSLSTREVLMICQTLLVGGTETSSSTTNNALLYLSDNPELADRLRADNSLVPAFVEESMRLNGPIHMLFRQAKAESTVGGVVIPKGARVGVHLGAAGRDQDRCPAPNGYDLTRHQPGQIMFGWGPHLCAGAELARVQVRVAVATLLQRLNNIKLAVPVDDIEYYPQINLRRIKSLPLRFSARP